MRLQGVELLRVELPLRSPFETSFGVQTARHVILVRAVTDVGEGWGECVALPDPVYSEEFGDAVVIAMRDFLVPALLAQARVTGPGVAQVLSPFKGQRMAKGALEMAVLDAELRAAGSEGILYPSVRLPGGQCAALQFPDLAANAMQGRHLDYHWNGERVDLIRDAGSGEVFRVMTASG